MKHLLMLLLLLAAACASSHDVTAPPTKQRAPDPYVTISIVNNLDTTSALSRAEWARYVLIFSADSNQTGISHIGNCVLVGADSVGQRTITVLGLADTLNLRMLDSVGGQSKYDVIAQNWYAGHDTLPPNYVAISYGPIDAFTSTQFAEGHGRTRDDPIRWQLIWIGTGTTLLVESPNDTTCKF